MKNLPRSLDCWGARSSEFLIILYQKILSRSIGISGLGGSGLGCRFFPSCSEYARQALRQYGLTAGIVVSIKRILRCHPWNRGGYDPVTKIPNS